MKFAQLKPNNTFDYEITETGNIEWDATHFCPASALTPEEAARFRVVPLIEVNPPAIDAMTQSVARAGGEFVNGQWQYKWTVTNLSAAQIAANQAAAMEDIKRRYTAALDSHYLSKANDRNYDTQYTCALRAGYVGPFQAEGIAFATWMDNCNAHAYQVMAQVTSGQAALPTIPDFIAGLPALVWP